MVKEIEMNKYLIWAEYDDGNRYVIGYADTELEAVMWIGRTKEAEAQSKSRRSLWFEEVEKI